MSLRDEQLRLAQALLAAQVDGPAWGALGGDPQRWQVYRRLVRARLRQTLEHALPMFIEVIGPGPFASLVDAFLAAGEPRSPYLRDLPGELLAFMSNAAATRSLGTWPAAASEVARYEWAELEVAYDHGVVERPIVPLTMDGVAALNPAHRVLDFSYPVQRAETASEVETLPREPVTLCVYRDARSYDAQTLELTPVAATLLRAMRAGDRPLADSARNAAAAHGVEVDVAFVEALSDLLASLVERGLLLGSFSDSETST